MRHFLRMRRNSDYPSRAHFYPATGLVESHAQAGPHWLSVPHLQAGPQAQAMRVWQPQVQMSPGQSRHWQALISSSFMAISLETGG